jgi:hypothetical protein
VQFEFDQALSTADRTAKKISICLKNFGSTSVAWKISNHVIFKLFRDFKNIDMEALLNDVSNLD